MRIAFHRRFLDYSPECELFYYYALYARSLLGIDVIVVTQMHHDLTQPKVLQTFNAAFSLFYYNEFEEIDAILASQHADFFYTLTDGYDEQSVRFCPTLSHSTHACHFRGNRFAFTSLYLAQKYNTSLPVVPVIVPSPECTPRRDPNYVIGICGSLYPWVRDALVKFLSSDQGQEYTLIFLGGENFACPRALFLPPAFGDDKNSFINACDVLISAREQGETVGLDVLRFVVAGKPVLAARGKHNAHLEYNGVTLFRNSKELETLLASLPCIPETGMEIHEPEKVMKVFEDVFLGLEPLVNHGITLRGYARDEENRRKKAGCIPRISANFGRFLTKDSVAVDVGAHIGWCTVALAQLAKEVHSFEPSHLQYYLLCQNTKGMANVTTYRVGLSSRASRAQPHYTSMHLYQNYPEDVSQDFVRHGDTGGGPEDFDVRTLDSYGLLKLDVLNVDAPRSEADVLAGAVETIKRCSPYIFITLRHDSINRQQVFDILERMYYRLIQLSPRQAEEFLAFPVTEMMNFIHTYGSSLRPCKHEAGRPGGLMLAVDW